MDTALRRLQDGGEHTSRTYILFCSKRCQCHTPASHAGRQSFDESLKS